MIIGITLDMLERKYQFIFEVENGMGQFLCSDRLRHSVEKRTKLFTSRSSSSYRPQSVTGYCSLSSQLTPVDVPPTPAMSVGIKRRPLHANALLISTFGRLTFLLIPPYFEKHTPLVKRPCFWIPGRPYIHHYPCPWRIELNKPGNNQTSAWGIVWYRSPSLHKFRSESNKCTEHVHLVFHDMRFDVPKDSSLNLRFVGAFRNCF